MVERRKQPRKKRKKLLETLGIQVDRHSQKTQKQKILKLCFLDCRLKLKMINKKATKYFLAMLFWFERYPKIPSQNNSLKSGYCIK